MSNSRSTLCVLAGALLLLVASCQSGASFSARLEIYGGATLPATTRVDGPATLAASAALDASAHTLALRSERLAEESQAVADLLVSLEEGLAMRVESLLSSSEGRAALSVSFDSYLAAWRESLEHLAQIAAWWEQDADLSNSLERGADGRLRFKATAFFAARARVFSEARQAGAFEVQGLDVEPLLLARVERRFAERGALTPYAKELAQTILNHFPDQRRSDPTLQSLGGPREPWREARVHELLDKLSYGPRESELIVRGQEVLDDQLAATIEDVLGMTDAFLYEVDSLAPACTPLREAAQAFEGTVLASIARALDPTEVEDPLSLARVAGALGRLQQAGRDAVGLGERLVRRGSLAGLREAWSRLQRDLPFAADRADLFELMERDSDPAMGALRARGAERGAGFAKSLQAELTALEAQAVAVEEALSNALAREADTERAARRHSLRGTDPNLKLVTDPERAEQWRSLPIGSTIVETDGPAQFVVVQDGPTNYRLKRLDTDPTQFARNEPRDDPFEILASLAEVAGGDSGTGRSSRQRELVEGLSDQLLLQLTERVEAARRDLRMGGDPNELRARLQGLLDSYRAQFDGLAGQLEPSDS